MAEVSERTHLLRKEKEQPNDVENGDYHGSFQSIEIDEKDVDRSYRHYSPKSSRPILATIRSTFTSPVDRPSQREANTKAVPAFAPYCRLARHRSYQLRWINEFRHWWKSSRLLVRLGGMWTYATEDDNWLRITTLNIMKKKGPTKALKLIKRLGQGGEMRFFLDRVKHFTRLVRIVVGMWRWLEAAPCRRTEVGVEEFMAFIGNRVFRLMSRKIVDALAAYIVIPFVIMLVNWGFGGATEWHSTAILLILGLMRIIAPFVASFYGSTFGRVLTRRAFHAAGDRWLPVMRIDDLNLNSDDCQEPDEVSPNADLVALAKIVAVALGKDTDLCSDTSPHRSDKYLVESGFAQVGSGSGGYTQYYYRSERLAARVHITPYGPSILDELPRYIVLEHDKMPDGRGSWLDFLSAHGFTGPDVVEGYCYKGAFFSPYQFAAMKERYEEELLAYDNACKVMCSTETSQFSMPPTDLVSLKAFLNAGRTRKQQNKDKHRLDELKNVVSKLSDRIKAKMRGHECVAPSGVIVYLEGLDCAGKSSTSGLVLAALEQSGYTVAIRRYNRPPTAEQRQHPWMDRFERPDTVISPASSTSACEGHQHTALVWDRGPAGDFVYGELSQVSSEEKESKYQEFMHFDAQCRTRSVMFLKLLFVTDRDSIARTLGKRLAHKKICKDLRKWLDASSGMHGEIVSREGLDEIDAHLDPSDFVAFNSYHNNLHKFVAFAKNTNTSEDFPWFNPWLVVSTTKRHPARRLLLHRFRRHFEYFIRNFESPSLLTRIYWFLRDEKKRDRRLRSLKRNAFIVRTVFIAMILLILVYIYYINTEFFTLFREYIIDGGD